MAATIEKTMEVNTSQGKLLATVYYKFRPEFYSGLSYEVDKDVIELCDFYHNGLDIDKMVSWQEEDRIQRELFDMYEESGELIPRDMPEVYENDFDEEL